MSKERSASARLRDKIYHSCKIVEGKIRGVFA
jgi:hypothetical protein